MFEAQVEHKPKNGNGGTAWSLGLSGWAKSLANLTAVAVVCIMLWRGQEVAVDLHREAMRACREELQEFRRQGELQRKHDAEMHALTRAMVQQNQQALEIIMERMK